jgi:hypothetical protein
MEFRLSEPEPGSFQIVRMEPAVVGTFTDRATAEKIIGFLEMDAINQARKPKAEVAETVAPSRPVEAAPPAPPPAKPAQAKPGPTKPEDQTAVEHLDWAADEVLAAFERLEAGEKVQEVAASFGKSWTALRARWAVHRQNRTRSKALVPAVARQTPVEKVASAVEELKGQEQCSLCQRHFKPSPDNPTHCARCSKDV